MLPLLLECSKVRVGLTGVDVDDENDAIAYLVFYAKAFDEEDSHSREIG